MDTADFVPLVMATLAVAAGVLASLMLGTMLLAGGANSTPRQLVVIKRCLALVAMIGLASVAGAVWACLAGSPWVGAGIGAAPVLSSIVVCVVMVKLSA